jgi:hypothetical protein
VKKNRIIIIMRLYEKKKIRNLKEYYSNDDLKIRIFANENDYDIVKVIFNSIACLLMNVKYCNKKEEIANDTS